LDALDSTTVTVGVPDVGTTHYGSGAPTDHYGNEFLYEGRKQTDEKRTIN